MTSVGHCVCLFVSWVTSVGHCVCLFVSWVTSVGHCVCLFWGGLLLLGNGCDICKNHNLLIVFGIFGSPEKDWLLVLKRTVYCSRSYILPSCQATAPSLLK